MSDVLELTQDQFENTIAENKVVVVDFWAPWCGPCRALAPTIDTLAQKFKNKVKFVKLNVDEATPVALKYNVASIPNVCLFKDGKLMDRSVGFVAEAVLAQMIEKHV